MVSYDFKGSATPDNKFQFHCPTVGRDATGVVCAFKIAKHKRGEDFADQDCRTAMCGGKCPVDRMMRLEFSTKQRHFHSSTPGLKPLPARISEELNRIILFPCHSRGFALSDDQKMRLFGRVTAENTADILIPAPSVAKPKTRKSTGLNKESSNSSEADDVLGGIAGVNLSVTDAINRSLNGDDE